MLEEQSAAIGHFLSLGPHGFHRLRYLAFGEASNRDLIVCVHGLTRNAHDFETLAQALAAQYRVVSLDVAGRGGSDRLSHPEDYGYPQYLQDAAALLAHLEFDRLTWIGTSMGGLIGMMLSAMPRTPIQRLVLNDIGPFVPASALERILTYVGREEPFRDIDEVEGYLRDVHAPFGALADTQWRFLAEHSAVKSEAGYCLHYDPAIAVPLRSQEIADVDLWALWDHIGCPTLVLRGAESDILESETADTMRQRGPRAELVTFPGIGHAPPLMSSEQIGTVASWMRRA